MRNLKRALSLTLASVMLLGMMVVGAGAAGYKDITDDHNVEAIEVLQAVGAMVGDEAGNFDPDANVNRAQIATIMSRLLDLKVEDFNAADIPFTDVPEWAVPFVAACYADGITSGISATAFGSSNNVTAVQAALMMMKALGYFQYQDDFEQDWQLATLKKASEIGLFNGVTVDRTSPLTRNDVAQMALNALKSNMVAFTGEVGASYPVNGETYRVGYKPEYTAQTSADAIYNRIDVGTTNIAEDDRYYVQLGEYLYGGDLRLTSDIDVFGRPARHWEFEGTDIGTYVKEELLRQQYTAGVTGKTVFDLLGRSMIQDSELFVYVDGDEKDTALNTANEIDKNDLVRSNDDDLKHTGRGVLTQVFVDTQNMEITIAIINTYLAQATTAYSEKNETISLKVYSSPNGDAVKSVPLADVPEIEGLANGDWMLVYLSNMDTANGYYRVVEIMDVEIIADVEIDEFSTKKVDKNDNYYNDGLVDDEDSVKTLVVGEDTYNRAYTQSYDRDVLKQYNDSALEDSTYNIYLDLYGNFIGVDLCEGTKNYVFIAGYDMNPSNITNRTAEALAIFPDGTMDNIRVDVKATNKNIERMYDTDLDDDGTDDVYADVYRAWQANSYAKLTGIPDGAFTYGTKNNPEEDDEGNKINYDGNVENLWYSYRVTDKGVYTLTPVSHFTIDGWDGNDDETERNTIRTDSVALWHQNAKDDPLPIDHWGTERSYGNTDSVYIVGSNDDNDFNNQVIGTVDGLYTSVDKVNITYQEGDGWANAVVDGNGYVVAAVILGEAEGAVDNYAYILKGAYAERYDRTTGTTYHKFDVYMNGEIKTLTTKDTYEDCVPNIKVNHVQELVLDNDGMVTRVRDLPNAGCDETVNSVAHAHWQNSLISTYKHDVVCLGEDFNYKTGKEDSVYDHMEAVNGTRITDYSVYYMDTDKVLKSANGKDYLDLYFKGDTLYMKDPAVEGLDKAGLFVASDAPALLISADGSKTEFATAKDAYSNIVDADSTKDGIQFNGHVAAALDSTGKAVWVVFYDETEVSGWKDEYQKVTSRIYFAHPDTTDDQKLNDGTHNFAINSKDKWAGVNSEGDLGFEFYVKDSCASTVTELTKQQLRIEYTVRIDSGRNSYVADQGRLDGVDITTGSTHNGEWFFRGTVYNRDYKVKTGDTVTVSIDKIWYVGGDGTDSGDPSIPEAYEGYSQLDTTNKKVHVGLIGGKTAIAGDSEAVRDDAVKLIKSMGIAVKGNPTAAGGAWTINTDEGIYTTCLHTLYTLKPEAAATTRAANPDKGVYTIDLTDSSGGSDVNLTPIVSVTSGPVYKVTMTGLNGAYVSVSPTVTEAGGNTSYGLKATGTEIDAKGKSTVTVAAADFTEYVATYIDNLVVVSVDNGTTETLYKAGSKFYSSDFTTTGGTWTTDANGVTNEIKTDSTGNYIVLGDKGIKYANAAAMAGASRTFSITDSKIFSGKKLSELGATGEADDVTLSIVLDDATGLSENQNAEVVVKTAKDVAKAYAYKVTLTFSDGKTKDVVLTKGSATTGGSALVKMTENLDITGVKVAVETPVFAVTEAIWDAGSVTFTFNLPVTEATAVAANFTVTDKSGGTISIGKVEQSNEGKTVTLVLTGDALEAADEVTVKADVKTETAANTLTATTFVLAEGGKATVKS